MNRTTRIIAVVLTLMLVAGLFVGCGSSKQATNQQQPKKLTLYCGLMEDHMVKTIQEFEKETGIKVDAVRMSSGEILGRIKAEKATPKLQYGGVARLTVLSRLKKMVC